MIQCNLESGGTHTDECKQAAAKYGPCPVCLLKAADRLRAAVGKLLSLPNWENRCGEWTDVNIAIREIKIAYDDVKGNK